MQDIISKEKAVEAGLQTYFDGEACENGHLSEKYTQTGNCRECAKLRNSYYLENLNTVSIEKRIGINLRKKNKAAEFARMLDDDDEHIKKLKRRLFNHAYRGWLSKSDKAAPTVEEIIEIFDKQEGSCSACYVPFTQTGYEIEHIIPLKAFGKHCRENIQLLCPDCNRNKRDNHFETWISKVRYEQVIQHLEDLMEEGY